MVTSNNSKFISQSSGLIPVRKYFRMSAHSPYHHLTFFSAFAHFARSYPMLCALRFMIEYLQMLLIRFVSPMSNAARLIPIVRTVIPCIEAVMNPNTCSMWHLIFDFLLLFCFCSSVSGAERSFTARLSQNRAWSSHFTRLFVFPLRFPTESPMCEHIGLSFCKCTKPSHSSELVLSEPLVFAQSVVQAFHRILHRRFAKAPTIF